MKSRKPAIPVAKKVAAVPAKKTSQVSTTTDYGRKASQRALQPAAAKKTPKATGKKSGIVWDLSRFFPTFEGPELKRFRDRLAKDIGALVSKARLLPPLDKAREKAWEEVFVVAEDLTVRLIHLEAYIGCLSAADAGNEAVQKEEGLFSLLAAELAKLDVELRRSLKSVSDADFSRFLARPALKGAEDMLRRTRHEAKKTMSGDEEVLAADLGVDGIMAWGRLYDQLSGKLTFSYKRPDGKMETVPMARRRSMMEDADPSVRREAFLGGNAAWEQVSDIAAQALNHIAGTRLTLNKHREVDHFLDVALHQMRVSHKTLDVLMDCIKKNIDLPRRMARLKAKALGLKACGWQDMDAALPLRDNRRFTWEEGRDLVGKAFGKVFPDLAQFYEMALEKGWVESEVRSGKRPGAFCTGSPMIKESRIFMTFGGSLGDVSTLAHEIGHAYHSDVMKNLRPYAQSYPMTLAESASTFAEMILDDGLMADPRVTDDQKAAVLNLGLSSGIAFLLNIPVRYEFEKAFHQERMKGEVSVTRLKELMVEKQREFYGDTLAKGMEDPLFWASKLHFYITGVTFYNFPYTFGFLLSRGMFARFKAEGASFLPKYREFLKLSGSYPAEEVAKRSLGIDLTKPAFWNDGIRSLEEPLKAFEKLLPKLKLK